MIFELPVILIIHEPEFPAVMTMCGGHIGGWSLGVTDLLDHWRESRVTIDHEIHYKPVLVKTPVRQPNAQIAAGDARGAVTGDHEVRINGVGLGHL